MLHVCGGGWLGVEKAERMNYWTWGKLNLELENYPNSFKQLWISEEFGPEKQIWKTSLYRYRSEVIVHSPLVYLFLAGISFPCE